MINRRKFIHNGLLGSASLLINKKALSAGFSAPALPIIMSTWSSNVKANNEAWLVLEKGGRGLDAVEKGVMVTEVNNIKITADNDAEILLMEVPLSP